MDVKRLKNIPWEKLSEEERDLERRRLNENVKKNEINFNIVLDRNFERNFYFINGNNDFPLMKRLKEIVDFTVKYSILVPKHEFEIIKTLSNRVVNMNAVGFPVLLKYSKEDDDVYRIVYENFSSWGGERMIEKVNFSSDKIAIQLFIIAYTLSLLNIQVNIWNIHFIKLPNQQIIRYKIKGFEFTIKTDVLLICDVKFAKFKRDGTDLEKQYILELSNKLKLNVNTTYLKFVEDFKIHSLLLFCLFNFQNEIIYEYASVNSTPSGISIKPYEDHRNSCVEWEEKRNTVNGIILTDIDFQNNVWVYQINTKTIIQKSIEDLSLSPNKYKVYSNEVLVIDLL